ncbi:MAG: hypothetical protein K2O01_03485, partial [Bacteroidales bacterium]|nr:hypothetical protein [Bacteroidales bacterium]
PRLRLYVPHDTMEQRYVFFGCFQKKDYLCSSFARNVFINHKKLSVMPSGKKRKRHKMATHKRKKRLRKNRHKKK